MKNILIAITTLFLLMLFSCKENVALMYEDDPALYFVNETYGQRDSIDHSFFFLPGDGPDTVYIRLHTMGDPAPVDRVFKLRQTNVGEPDAAKAGVHFVSFDDPAVAKYFVIPANGVSVRLPFILLRDKSLDLNKVRLEMTIEENENFRPGIDKWRNFLLKTTSQAVKPAIWDSRWHFYFGKSWGSVKMKFIIDHTGYTDWETTPDSGFTSYLRTKVLHAFQQYNLENPDNPLREADGTLVSFTE